MRKSSWWLCLGLFLCVGLSSSFGQILSTKAGNWDDPTVWSTGVVPTSASGAIVVRHTVHVRSSVYPIATPLLIDETTVGANGFSGYLIVDSGAGLQIANGPAVDLALTGTPTIGKIDVSGRLALATGTVISGNTTANLNYLAGGTYEHQATSAATALPTATYNAASTILISGFTGSSTLAATWNVPIGNLVYNCASQAAGVVNFSGFLRQIQGNLDIQNTGATGRVTFNSSGTSTIAGATAIVIGGNLSVTGLSRLWLTSTGTVEATVGGDFLFSPNASSGTSQSAASGTGTMRVTGNATLSSGTWNFSSANNGNGAFDLRGNITTTGAVLTESGGGTSQGNLNFNGTTGQQSFDGSGLAATTINIAVANSSGAVFTSNLTLTGTLTLTSGAVELPGTTLILNGPVAQTSGSLTNGAASTPTLRIGGAGALPANLSIVNGSTFNLLELNRPSSTLVSSSNFSISRLNLYAGTFTNSGTVTMNAGGLVDRQATSATATGVLSNPLAAAGTYDVQYTNTVALTSGPELPTNATPLVLNNLTKAGTNTLTLNNDLTINGILSVNAGTLTDGGTPRVINLAGNFVSGGTATSLGSSTFSFSSGAPASTLSGAIAPVFGALDFSHNVAISSSFRVNGNLTVGTGISATTSAGTASFGGTTAVTNNGTLSLNAVTILANSSLTAPVSTLGIGGNLLVTNGTSTFTHNSGTVLFNGTTAISGTGAIVFNNLTVSGTLGSAVSLRSNGNVVNNGTINLTAGTMTFGGPSGTLTGTPVATNFFTTAIAASSSLTSSIPFTTNGAFTVNGTGIFNAGFTSVSTLTVSATGTATVNTSPFSVTGTLTVTTPGTFTANTGANATLSGALAATGPYTSSATTTFPGATTITGAGSKSLRDVVITGTLTPNATYTITGNLSLSGTGTLLAGNSTTTFGGTTVFSNAGSGTAAFNNLSISATRSLTANSNFTVTGTTFTSTGNYTSTATTIFGRAGTTTMAGAGTKRFANITINSGATFTPNAAYTITGNISTTGILSAGNNTTTFDGTSAITITAPGTVAFNSIVINATHSLTSSPGNITVNGNFTDNGTFVANSGRVTFAGNTANRTISGSSVTGFFNITVSNGTQATDLSIGTNKDLFGVLTMAANARMDPDGAANTAVFTLRSTADSPANDASIAALPNPTLVPAQISGSITVQRYMSPEGRIYRYIATPVQGASVASWIDNFPITGSFSNPSNPGVICGKTVIPANASMFVYNESTLPAGAYAAYPVSGTAASNPLTVGRGYSAFIRECTLPTVIDTRGTLVNAVNMGTVNLPVTFTPAATGHFNLVGNPYPSAIDWDNFNTRTGVSGTIAVRDNGTGVYHYWTNTTLGSNGFGDVPNGVIAQGQAFWATTTAAAPILRLTEAAKVASPASSGNIFFRENSVDPDLLIITVAGSTQTQIDKAYILRDPGAAIGMDTIDGPKLDNYIDDPFTQLFDLFTTTSPGGLPLAVDAIPSAGCSAQLNLVLRDAKPGTYSYTFNELGEMSTMAVSLFDKFTGQTKSISEGSVYAFSITTAPASQSADRFTVIFSDTPMNFDLPVEGISNVCGPTSSVVTVKNAEVGIIYGAEVNGVASGESIEATGGDIQFTIPTEELLIGMNHISITATSTCTSATLNNGFDIDRDSIAIALPISGMNCREGSVTLHASGGESYRWYEATDTTIAIAGQTLSEFTTPVLTKTKTYYVSAINKNGCEGPKSVVKAEIVNYDDATITATGTPPVVQLLSNATTGNQWFLNGEAIQGATAQVYNTGIEGTYTVQVMYGSCSSTSQPYENKAEVVSGLLDESNSPGVSISPNPVSEILTVRVTAERVPYVVILNSKGQQMAQVEMNGNNKVWTGNYNCGSFAMGVYLVQITDGPKQTTHRIIRQ